MSSRSKRSRVVYSLGAIGLVVYGFFVSQIAVLFLIQAFVSAGILPANSLESAVLQFNASFLAYLLALGIILGTFTAIRNSSKGLKDILGIKKRPSWGILYYIFAGYGIYFLLSFVLMALSELLIPGFNVDEKQSVGFEQLNGQLEYVMAFLALVVLAPVVEETIFRGFLFGRLRRNMNFWWTAIVVSLVFGAIHMQLNVGVDVFALSLILCYVREKTGSIWAGVGIHMVKNSLAFAILFLQLDLQNLTLNLLH